MTRGACRRRACAKCWTRPPRCSGLDADEVAVLMQLSDPELLGEMFDTAKAVKERIYGKRLVLFAPLYISNLCCNECRTAPFARATPRSSAAR